MGSATETRGLREAQKIRDQVEGPAGDKRVVCDVSGRRVASLVRNGWSSADAGHRSGDEPRVQKGFEYYTDNRVGRERFPVDALSVRRLPRSDPGHAR